MTLAIIWTSIFLAGALACATATWSASEAWPDSLDASFSGARFPSAVKAFLAALVLCFLAFKSSYDYVAAPLQVSVSQMVPQAGSTLHVLTVCVILLVVSLVCIAALFSAGYGLRKLLSKLRKSVPSVA